MSPHRTTENDLHRFDTAHAAMIDVAEKVNARRPGGLPETLKQALKATLKRIGNNRNHIYNRTVHERIALCNRMTETLRPYLPASENETEGSTTPAVTSDAAAGTPLELSPRKPDAARVPVVVTDDPSDDTLVVRLEQALAEAAVQAATDDTPLIEQTQGGLTIHDVAQLAHLLNELRGAPTRSNLRPILAAALSPAVTLKPIDPISHMVHGAGACAETRRFVYGQYMRNTNVTVSMLMQLWTEAKGTHASPAVRRSMARYLERLRDGGTLIDRRKARLGTSTALPPLIRALIAMHFIGGRLGSATAIRRRLDRDLPQWRELAKEHDIPAKLDTPSRQTVARFMATLPGFFATARRDGVEAAAKVYRPHDRYSRALKANECWRIDHTEVDMVVARIGSGGEIEPIRFTFTALVDEATLACLGWILSPSAADAFSTSRVLWRALHPWPETGRYDACLPKRIITDNGADFTSANVKAVMESLGVMHTFTRVGRPNDNAEVESFIGSVNKFLLSLPGATGRPGMSEDRLSQKPERLLSVEELKAELLKWTHQHNMKVVPGTGQTRIDRWAGSLGAEVPVDIGFRLLRTSETAKLTREGLRFRNRTYRGSLRDGAGRTNAELIGTSMRIHYDPDKPDTLWLTTHAPDDDPSKELFVGRVTVIGDGEPHLDYRSDVTAPVQSGERTVAAFDQILYHTDVAAIDAARRAQTAIEITTAAEALAAPRDEPRAVSPRPPAATLNPAIAAALRSAPLPSLD